MQILEKEKHRFYEALVGRDSSFVGTFFVGIRTTGIFCHAICPARKPKFENCEFYKTAKEALLAGYRPCKRCHPLSNPALVPSEVDELVQAVEAEPEKRWKDRDFELLSTNAVRVRRQFQKNFGMTFVEYARSRRMGIGLKAIKEGAKVIEAQLSAGFESESGFRDAFASIMGQPISRKKEVTVLKASWISTKLGGMVAIADEEALLLLEFVDRRGLELEVEKLRNRLNGMIVPGKNKVLDQIGKELEEYYDGKLTEFQTPIRLLGSDFQKSVWEELRRIPAGKTRTYQEQAEAIGKPQAVRAVGRANGMNQLAIIVPCHRVIGKNGDLVGYAGGLERKRWLLEMEARLPFLEECNDK